MKIRDELINDMTSAMKSYTSRYSQYQAIPQERRADIQAMHQILQERNPVKMRKKLENKLHEFPSGFFLFFLPDLRKFRAPLLDVLDRDQYQRAAIRDRYEDELIQQSTYSNQEDHFQLAERVSQLENKVTRDEKRTHRLEHEINLLSKENDFLTKSIQKLMTQNQYLEKEKQETEKQTLEMKEKFQTAEEKYQQLCGENKRLKVQLRSVKYKVSTFDDIEVREKSFSSRL